MRTLIDIPEERIAELDAYSRRIGKSRAEVVREAIRLFLNDKVAATDEAFGMWADRGLDGLAYQDELRSEWERGEDASALRHEHPGRLPQRRRRGAR